jgi:hypothetical protein
MSKVRLNAWAQFRYHKVDELMPKLRELQLALSQSSTEDKIRNLRTHKLRKYQEGWNACVFLKGIAAIHGYEAMAFALVENQDFDVVGRHIQDDAICYAPIQIKEYKKWSDETPSLESELQKLTKYTDSLDLVIAYFLSGKGTIDFNTLKIPKLKIGSLWFFGNVTADQSEWFLYGDALSDPTLHKFKIA